MKKLFLFLSLFILLSNTAKAQSEQNLSSILPLLQAKTRTTAQNVQVLSLFDSAKDANTIFAAGASLVRITPPKAYEAKLLNIIIKDDNMLKKVFSAVILTAMGTEHQELSSLLQDATFSQDRALRSYAAAAYTILNPQKDIYKEEIINLYIYDPAFATRAMNLISKDEKQTFKYLKETSRSDVAQVRAATASWLGQLQTEKAAKQLLKMAKNELDPQAANALAVALSQNKNWTLDECAKALKTRYTAQQSSTYALALGFMTGHAIDTIKKGLLNPDVNIRINSARAAAYMAAVLSSPQANQYTQDKEFDITLLKSLIPALSAMVKRDQSNVKVYADNALKQMAKLI